MYPTYSHMTADQKEKLPRRREADFYPTELNLIRAAYAAELSYEGPIQSLRRILDPAAGDGRWGRIAREMFSRPGDSPAHLVGIDLRQLPAPNDYSVWNSGCDFRTIHLNHVFDLIATNPPYGPKVIGKRRVALIYEEQGWEVTDRRRLPRSLTASEWYVRKCWQHLANRGRMMFLFPLNFMTGQDRFENLFMTLPPARVYPLARRPSFYDGGTNSTDYGIFVWQKDSRGVAVGWPQRFDSQIISYDRDTEEGQ